MGSIEGRTAGIGVFKSEEDSLIHEAIRLYAKETNGDVYDSTMDTHKGPVAKNQLGVRGIDAVQVSRHP
jgi:hypothetical protein